jgi:hypothetical protein
VPTPQDIRGTPRSLQGGSNGKDNTTTGGNGALTQRRLACKISPSQSRETNSEDSGGEDSGGEDSGGEDSGRDDFGSEDSGSEDSGSSDKDSEPDSGRRKDNGRKRVASPCKTPVKKRPKYNNISSTDQLDELLQDEGSFTIHRASYYPGDIARAVAEEVLLSPDTSGLVRETLAGVSLLSHIFTKRGWDNFRCLYREHHKTLSSDEIKAATRMAQTVVSDLQTLGCPTLSQLVGLWSRLKREEAGGARTCGTSKPILK